jgi:hypothetical protein
MMRRLCVVAAAALLVSCSPAPEAPPTATSPTAQPSPTEETATPPARPVDLQPIIDDVVAVYGGTAGVAVSDGGAELVGGDDGMYPAWSTIKVPIAIAALRQDPSLAPIAAAAIQYSDNDAAQQLWATLSPGAADAVLAEGDNDVQVNTAALRPEFSLFGQTAWAPSQQARFAAHLPCIAGADEVVASMGQVTAEQAYGIGRLPDARFKGGWGPDLQGKYTVRQFGVVAGPAGDVAVALTVAPASGTYADAQAMATQIADGLSARLSQLPSAVCGGATS